MEDISKLNGINISSCWTHLKGTPNISTDL